VCGVVERCQGGEQPTPPVHGQADQEPLAVRQGRDRRHAPIVGHLDDLPRGGEADVDRTSVGDRKPLGELALGGIERGHRLHGRVARDGDTGHGQAQRDDDQWSDGSSHHGLLPSETQHGPALSMAARGQLALSSTVGATPIDGMGHPR
jgi:hypothetical protein